MIMTKNIYFIHDDGSAMLKCGDHRILLDGEDVELVSNYQWCVGTHGYATNGAGKNQLLFHRLVTKANSTDFVDHINRNKLDNRKSNLRICTAGQNAYNKEKLNTNTSGYKGVCLLKNDRWQAQIGYDGKSIYLGIFLDAVSAAMAYDKAALRLTGDFALLNFPDSVDAKFDGYKVAHKQKLTLQQAEDVRFLNAKGYSISDLAVIYDHSYSAIRRIVKNRTFNKKR